MDRPISDIAFTPALNAAQEARGSRRPYSKMGEAVLSLIDSTKEEPT